MYHQTPIIITLTSALIKPVELINKNAKEHTNEKRKNASIWITCVLFGIVFLRRSKIACANVKYEKM